LEAVPERIFTFRLAVCFMNSSINLDFPIPASPEIKNVLPLPTLALSRHSLSALTSVSRPTKPCPVLRTGFKFSSVGGIISLIDKVFDRSCETNCCLVYGRFSDSSPS